MPSISDEIADEFVGYAVNLQRYSASVETDVREFLAKLEENIVNQLIVIGVDTPARTVERQRRLSKLLTDVRTTVATTYEDISKHVGAELTELAGIEAVASAGIVNTAIGVSVASSGLSKEFLASVASDVLIKGAPSKEWWSRQSDRTTQRFSDAVRLGLVQGLTVSEIVRQVRGSSTGRRKRYKTSTGAIRYTTRFRGGIFDVITRDATALVLTSVQTISQEARFQFYQNNSDLIKGVQALVTLDNRTSQICMSRSGNSWRIDGTPLNGTAEPFPGRPPWHWRCRSTLIPLLYNFADIVRNVTPAQRKALRDNVSVGTQASIDGQVAGDLNYEAWLKTKDVAFQRNVLGPTRLSLWQKGRITFRDLVDQTGNPLSVAELKLLYPAP